MTPEPCAKCGTPSTLTLGTEVLCNEHREAVLVPLRAKWPTTWFDGIGEMIAPRTEYGEGWGDLRCDTCGATWVGIDREPCGWCIESKRRLDEHAAELATTPPDADPHDATYASRMTAWAGRMATAVDAGVINQSTADRAWRNATQRTLRDAS